MYREIVIRPAAVDPVSAAWIRANVLSRTPSTRKDRKWDGPDIEFRLIEHCNCLGGACGWCKDLGQHDRCAHRLGTAPKFDGYETWLAGAGGAALERVWVRQVFDGMWPGCRWVCSCQECERIGAPLLPAATAALPPVRRQRGPMAGQRPLF